VSGCRLRFHGGYFVVSLVVLSAAMEVVPSTPVAYNKKEVGGMR